MTNSSTASRLTPVLAMTLLLLGPGAARAELRPERIGWSELHYSASKLGFSIRSALRLETMSKSELDRALVAPPPTKASARWLEAPPDGGWLLHLETAGLGKQSRLELLIDRDGRSLQRIQVETGRRLKDHHDRTYRFGRDSVYISSRKPTARETDRPSHDWSDLYETTDDLGTDLPPDAVVGQSTGLFYLLAAAGLDAPGDRLRTHVLSKGRVMTVELEVEGLERIAAKYLEVRGAETEHRSKSIDAVRIRVRGGGLDSDEEDDDFRFLGLKGDVHVYVDTATRAPVLITGRIGWLGRANVKLDRLVLSDR